MALSGFYKNMVPAVMLVVASAAGFLCPEAGAAADGDSLAKMFDPGIKVPTSKTNELQHARADQWRMVGRTIFVKGNVYIPYGNLTVRADQAMIDLESRDLEAKGNIRLSVVRKSVATVTLDELERLQALPDTVTEITGIVIDPLGNRKLNVIIYSEGSRIEAERLSGNFATGLVNFTKLKLQVKNFVCKADHGTRQPGGELKLDGIELSSCEYLNEDQSHFSIGLDSANLYPHETEGYGFSYGESDQGEYSIWGYNGTFRIYGVPVLWLPMFYKPKDESPGLFQMQVGETSDWGYYMLLSRKFQISDDPFTTVSLDLDWYGLRGLGYGARTSINTATSKTYIGAYSIYDIRPYESSGTKPGGKGGGRLDIPHERFDFQVTNMTHISPRLDFRGQIEWLSDAYMLEDYFQSRANTISEPASYAAFEYQANHFSSAIYARFQVNKFFTTVQRLPELRMDMPRQEILPGTNLYYQGSHTADYLTMNWAEFDRPLKNPDSKVEDYHSGRFDSVNFLYYPIRASMINIVPRAGLRMTGYTNSSKAPIDTEDVYRMQLAANTENDYGLPVKNYDDDGGSRFRFAFETGIEINTKIYRSWQDVRNAFWELDGLRHVAEPYINYTFLPEPTVNRDYLFFFDDIDRIDEQNFLRLGLRNRLQTRTGGFASGRLREWFNMENYWDIYFDEMEDFNHIGDFCTKLTFSPTSQVTLTGFLQIDAGQNQDHDTEAQRAGRDAGRPGLSTSLLNRAYLALTYSPIEDLIFNLSYNYQDAYVGRAAYSMGSTLTEIESGSVFDQYYGDSRTQTINFGVLFPITPDRKTFGAYNISYDFEEGGITQQTLGVSRIFHCVKVSALLSRERERDDDNSLTYNHSFSVNATLVGLEEPVDAVRRTAVSKLTGLY